MAFDRMTTTRTIKQITKFFKENAINFDLAIQRRLVWKDKQKTDLINSIIINMPIPAVWVAGTEWASNGNSRKVLTMNCADGKQRLNTINSFINNEFQTQADEDCLHLECSEGIEQYNGKTFSELPEDIQEAIMDYQVTFEIFQGIEDEELEYFFFKFNSGGSPLTKTELTRSTLSGTVLSFIENELITLPFWSESVSITDKAKERYGLTDIALQTLNINYNGSDVESSQKALNEFAKTLKAYSDTEEWEETKQTFLSVSEYLYDAIPDRDSKLIKSTIPAIVNIAITAQKENISPIKFGGMVQAFLKDKPSKWKNANGDGTTSKSANRQRMEAIEEFYKGNIHTCKNYVKPEPKGTGKPGRKANTEEQTITDLPSEPVNNEMELENSQKVA